MASKNILVLCTGNSCRSIMTEAVLKKHGGSRYNVHSAGTEPAGIHPLTLKVLEEKGYETSGLHSKGLNEFLGKMTFEHVIFVCQKAEKSCAVTFPGTLSRLSWPFEDPAIYERTEELQLEKFRKVFAEIEKKAISWLNDDTVTPVPKIR